MKKYEITFWFLIFAGILPIMLFLAGWWGTLGRVTENKIFIFALTGLGLGILVDVIFYKKILSNLFCFNNYILVIVYLFYSVCIFGFFMGVPVFNLIAGIVSGAYIARKSTYNKCSRDDFKKELNAVSIFVSLVMLFACFVSSYIALHDKYTVSGIEKMSGIEFSYLSLSFLIIFGGIMLIVSQYFLTKGSGILFYRNGKQ